MTFADTLPDLSQSPVPYPSPKDAGEVCANRLATRNSGATQLHKAPTVNHTQMENRIAVLEKTIGILVHEYERLSRAVSDMRYRGHDE